MKVELQEGEELVDDKGAVETAGISVQLLEVNAFPDFAQTGDRLRDVIVKGLLEEVVREVVAPQFGVVPLVRETDQGSSGRGRLEKVLEVDQHLH